MKHSNDILQGNLTKVIWLLALPIALTNMIEAMYGIIDSLFVANVGTIAVASVAFVGPIQDTLNAVATGVSIAGCSLIARYIGAGDEVHARKMIGHLLVIGLVVGAAVSAFSFTFAEAILLQAGATESILADAAVYLRLTSCGVLFNFIMILYLAIQRAQGRTKVAIIINGISISLKVLFCFVFTVWQDFGIAGIGYATVLAQGTCGILCVFNLLSHKNDRRLTLPEYKLSGSLSKVLLVMALPLVIEKSLISYGFVITNSYVLAFGEDVLAAYGLTNKVNTVFFKSVTALGTGLSVLVAQNLGAGNPLRAKQAVRKTLISGVLLSCASLLLVLPLRAQIAALFISPTESTYTHMVTAMTIYTASIIPWGITECVLGVFQGTGKTKFNLLISLMRIYVFRVPVVIIFSQPMWGLAERGIWYAMLVSNTLSAIFALSLYFIKRNKVLVSAK